MAASVAADFGAEVFMAAAAFTMVGAVVADERRDTTFERSFELKLDETKELHHRGTEAQRRVGIRRVTDENKSSASG